MRAFRKAGLILVSVAGVAGLAWGDVPLTDTGQLRARRLERKEAQKQQDGQQRRAAGTAAAEKSTGAQALTDMDGVEWFINTDITFSTTSSASGAASEASYTDAVTATTSAGGTTTSTLNDAFDGYNTLCLSLNGSTGPCETGDANYTIYNELGPATTECGGRQVVFPVMTVGQFEVSRKVYIPSDDAFGRWMNIVTNTGGAAATITLVASNNLGSDSDTVIFDSSNGNTSAELTDTWVGTFQNYSGNTSSDPRLAHILRGPGAPVGLANVNFVDGDDGPYWAYNLTVGPGETAIVVNFAVAQPSKAAAISQANALVALPNTSLECMTPTEQTDMVNFVAQAAAGEAIPTISRTGIVLMTLLLAAAATIALRFRA
jgi:hypothetical protein